MTTTATTAVIMARGLGTRMRRAHEGAVLDPAQQAAAALGLKAMIPDAHGRPLLDHILTALADGGVREVILVVAPDHEVLRRHFADRPPRRLVVRFAIQTEASGTADAVLAAEGLADGRPFLVCNADNLYPVVAIEALVRTGGSAVAAFDRDALIAGSNIEPERIAGFASLEMNADGLLTGIVEKPGLDAAGGIRWIGMNLWRFGPDIFAACRDVPRSERGERELPQAVALALTRGARIAALPVHAGVLDLSSRGDVVAVAAALAGREIAT